MMTEAIEKMMQRLDEKLDEFRKELKEGQDKVAATAARRARQEPRYVFKKSSDGWCVAIRLLVRSHPVAGV